MSANSRYFDTIVIGAGISGLACAARLFQHRARAGTVAILEARERIGGRIGSVHINGNRLDTGANWIHGIGTKEHPNPLMDILPHKRYKQLSGSVSFRPPDDSEKDKPRSNLISGEHTDWQEVPRNAQSNPSGFAEDLVIPSEFATVIQKAMWGTIEAMHEVAATTPPTEAKQTSVLSALKRSATLSEAFDELPITYHRALSGMLQFMEPMEAAPLAAQSAEHTQDTPGMSLLEYAIEDFDGDQVFLQDGYIAIVQEVAKDLVEAGCIQTGIEVEQITWETKPISIKTSSGTYTANNVVCTLPLGVLKERQHLSEPADFSKSPLFTPALPHDTSQAISSLGFGTLDKVFMVYSYPWWTEEPFLSILNRGFSRRPFTQDNTTTGKTHGLEQPDFFAGFTEELPGIQIHQDGSVTSGPRLLSMTNLHSLSGFPVLCSFVSCANAVHIESLSDEEAGKLIHRNLTIWFGQEPPKPEAVHVTRWANDPYSLGSYSHMITGASETKHRETFQQPIANRHGATLRFAGEHTSRNHFATVHGALLSGWREADSILKERES